MKKASSDRIIQITTEVLNICLGKKKPKGMCFTICHPLSMYFHALGIDNTLVSGEYKSQPENPNVRGIGHFWLVFDQYPDIILDPTFQQFYPKGDYVHFKGIPATYFPDKENSFETHYNDWITPLLNNGRRYPQHDDFKKIKVKNFQKYLQVSIPTACFLKQEFARIGKDIQFSIASKRYFNDISEVIRRNQNLKALTQISLTDSYKELLELGKLAC